MAMQKWRNPYTPINKKNAPIPAKASNVAVTQSQKSSSKFPIVDLRASVTKMRSNLKGISSTIRQMEETMDTIYGAMDMIDSLGKSSSRTNSTQRKASQAVPTFQDELEYEQPSEGKGNSNPLGNIDLNHLLSLLQSPLVQSLLTQNTASGSKRKKEG